MKVVTIIGARPQFVKAAVVSRVFKNNQPRVSEIIIHTGQHYDSNMSDIFFEEMEIPKPNFNLGVGGGRHGSMTGQMLEKIEDVLLEVQPDWTLVYGDTNSTIAGALASAKLNIPVAHVEAGLRSFNRRMPEEINRVATDHISDLLFAPTQIAVQNLKREGVAEERIILAGDVMLDAALFYRDRASGLSCNASRLPGGDFALCTIHRAENTDDPQRLANIVDALEEIAFSDIPIYLPLHPRTQRCLAANGFSFKHVTVIDPVGYYDMLVLLDRCRFVLTDSGGLQKEAYFFEKPCITLRDETEWVELVESGANQLVGAQGDKILSAVRDGWKDDFESCVWPAFYGDGQAGDVIFKTLYSR
ncbi:UDP-N-acetylglucosamine 2-epimerase [Syntrophotalea acetylenivorans]|uniref:UDP-N-acetylglucosamine 2-epimerase n=1 Tax=Syntrophotalea acetylenivorans TaxID=1842532 RepID=A0A1L3GL68_9BACT|nr:UDP-N-acetylglucosamine 2-epimerase (non-hydrolyzing) [Syntrophotalea acetylenivorans]APG26664.1 UDP-N-acetylglucosamine 2-epimerase [Syntrophotalea acetylenivorans]